MDSLKFSATPSERMQSPENNVPPETDAIPTAEEVEKALKRMNRRTEEIILRTAERTRKLAGGQAYTGCCIG